MSRGKLYRDLIENEEHNAVHSEGIEEILDESANEFLGFVYDLDQQFVLDWFKKWFGDKFYASMPQVVGGCTGHIDLDKIQNVEKEP
jgi:hypothetical protein